ncbi:MAG: hypothetical protein ABJN69_09375 [Hellea sp.]
MTPKLAANILRLMGWGFIIFGVIFVTIAFAGIDGFARSLVPIFDWTGGVPDIGLTREARWFAAIMSGLSAGLGAFYAFLVAPLLNVSHSQTRQIAKRGGLIAAVIWFVVDSTGSFGAGVSSNIVMNFVFLIGLAAPLLMVKFPE